MEYPEFNKYQNYRDPENGLVHAYEDEAGNRFYVEPGFYDGLKGFEEKWGEKYPQILEAIDKTVKRYGKVIFTADFENPWVSRPGFIYREIHDITDPLRIFVEDKSRGSDYGD